MRMPITGNYGLGLSLHSPVEAGVLRAAATMASDERFEETMRAASGTLTGVGDKGVR